MVSSNDFGTNYDVIFGNNFYFLSLFLFVKFGIMFCYFCLLIWSFGEMSGEFKVVMKVSFSFCHSLARCYLNNVMSRWNLNLFSTCFRNKQGEIFPDIGFRCMQHVGFSAERSGHVFLKGEVRSNFIEKSEELDLTQRAKCLGF